MRKYENIAVLGSTGSIGRQTLDVIRQSDEEQFSVFALCADSNAELLAEQANEFKPSVVGIAHANKYQELKDRLNYSPDIVVGDNAANLCGGQRKSIWL